MHTPQAIRPFLLPICLNPQQHLNEAKKMLGNVEGKTFETSVTELLNVALRNNGYKGEISKEFLHHVTKRYRNLLETMFGPVHIPHH